jgi:GT2 family glycosyltransferase
VAPSQRRFPRLRSTFAQALFLHRLAPEAPWVDELIREPSAYERAGTPDWVSGACMLVRRDVLEAIGGLDEGYFLYCEDTDLCYRVRQAGYDIRFEPTATAFHQGGASRPSSELRGVLATSRLRYARMRHGRWVALAEAVGIALGETTHLLVSLNRPGAARGHAKALRSLVRPGRPAIHARGSAV